MIIIVVIIIIIILFHPKEQNMDFIKGILLMRQKTNKKNITFLKTIIIIIITIITTSFHPKTHRTDAEPHTLHHLSFLPSLGVALSH